MSLDQSQSHSFKVVVYGKSNSSWFVWPDHEIQHKKGFDYNAPFGDFSIFVKRLSQNKLPSPFLLPNYSVRHDV